MKLRIVCVAFMVLGLAACISTDIELDANNQFNPAIQSGFAWKTKPIAKPEHIGRGESYYLFDRYMRRYVNKELTAKGYKLSDKAQTDFLVEYHFVRKVRVDQGGIISPSDELNAAWDVNADLGNTALHNHYVPAQIREAMLEIKLSSAQGNKFLWQVTASKIVEEANVDEEMIRNVLRKLVPEMLVTLPKKAE